MKYSFIILAVASVAWLNSCTKKIEVIHNNYDTIYLSHISIDTFHTIIIRTDTVTKTLMDTSVQVKHDTLFITKTSTDTLFRTYIDTAYLTRTVHDTTIKILVVVQHDTTIKSTTNTVYDTVTLVKTIYDTLFKNVIVQVHDTVSKNVYLYDTINNFVKVYLHDTVIRINTVIERDTITRYQGIAGYPTPATDSVTMAYFYDTTGFADFKALTGHDFIVQLIDITFTSVIPSSDGTFQTFTNTPHMGLVPYRTKNLGIPLPMGLVITAPKMLCTVTFHYNTWEGVKFSMDSYAPFEQNPTTTWSLWTWGKVAQNFGATNTSEPLFLDEVYDIII